MRDPTSRKPVTVGNVSAGSWGPGNWLAYAQEYGFFDADAVILVISSHDIADNPSFASLDPATHPQRTPASALIEGAMRYLPRYLPDLPFGGAAAQQPRAKPSRAQAVARGSKDLREFPTLARSHVLNVAVILHPTRSELKGDDWAGRRQIAAIATSEGIPVYSLDEVLQRAIDRGKSPYRDNIHINATGQKALQEKLLAVLIETDVVSGP